jgi:hypothetical protein
MRHAAKDHLGRICKVVLRKPLARRSETRMRVLISDVYIQEGTRMLAVSRCRVSDHAAIASKSKDTKAAALAEVGGAGPSHYRTSARPKFRTAASPDLIPSNPLASVGFR